MNICQTKKYLKSSFWDIFKLYEQFKQNTKSLERTIHWELICQEKIKRSYSITKYIIRVNVDYKIEAQNLGLLGNGCYFTETNKTYVSTVMAVFSPTPTKPTLW